MAAAVIVPSYTDSFVGSEASPAVSKSDTRINSSGDVASKFVTERHTVTVHYFYPPRDVSKCTLTLSKEPAHTEDSSTFFRTSSFIVDFDSANTDVVFYFAILYKGELGY